MGLKESRPVQPDAIKLSKELRHIQQEQKTFINIKSERPSQITVSRFRENNRDNEGRHGLLLTANPTPVPAVTGREVGYTCTGHQSIKGPTQTDTHSHARLWTAGGRRSTQRKPTEAAQ